MCVFVIVISDVTEIARHTPTRRQSAPVMKPGDVQGVGVVHAQYNSPMGLYSQSNRQTTFGKAAQMLEEEINR